MVLLCRTQASKFSENLETWFRKLRVLGTPRSSCSQQALTGGPAYHEHQWLAGWLSGTGGVHNHHGPVDFWGQGAGIMSIPGWLGGFGGREGRGKLIGSQPHVREPIVLWGRGERDNQRNLSSCTLIKVQAYIWSDRPTTYGLCGLRFCA